jgi:hypothetical protein
MPPGLAPTERLRSQALHVAQTLQLCRTERRRSGPGSGVGDDPQPAVPVDRPLVDAEITRHVDPHPLRPLLLEQPPVKVISDAGPGR